MSSDDSWQYDELKQIGTDYDNVNIVKNYDDRMSQLRNAVKEADSVIKKIEIKKNQIILEIGTGTGDFAIEASEYCKNVIAIDISRPMIEHADHKAKSKNIKNIKFLQSGFLTYEHKEPPVDAVVSQLVLHHLPDFWKAVAIKRIFDFLKPGGIFYLKDVVFPFGLENYKMRINDSILQIQKQAGAEIADSLKKHIQNEYSTFGWIIEEMIKKVGFSIISTDYNDNIIAKYICKKNN